ncbi:MAG: hypothetical protein SGJ17_06675 [Hyphomicrobiales bacterium]|nr:hypothetical protein [Hyphomicrobiales bacterium]
MTLKWNEIRRAMLLSLATNDRGDERIVVLPFGSVAVYFTPSRNGCSSVPGNGISCSGGCGCISYQTSEGSHCDCFCSHAQVSSGMPKFSASGLTSDLLPPKTVPNITERLSSEALACLKSLKEKIYFEIIDTSRDGANRLIKGICGQAQ